THRRRPGRIRRRGAAAARPGVDGGRDPADAVTGRPGDAFRAEPRPGDIAAVRDLVATTGFFSAEEIAVAAELVEERLARGPASGYAFFFADAVAGLAGYSCFGRIALTQASYDLYWIVVAPAAQRTGLGRRLLGATEAAVMALGGQ